MTTVQQFSELTGAEKLEARDYLQAVLDATADGILLINPKGTIVAVNAATVCLAGCPEEEMLGKSFETLQMLPLKSLADIQSRLRAVMSGLDIPPFEAEARAATGEPLKLEIRLSPWEKAGKTAGVVALVRDVAGHGVGEPAVPTHNDRFRDLVETTSDLVWETNAKGMYTYISPQIYNALGYKPEEVLGKTLFDFMPLQEARRWTREMNAAVASQQPFRALQVANLHKNGQTVFLEMSGVPFCDGAGRLAGYRGIHRDVTQRRAAEEQVHETIKKLESTVESVIQAISLTVEMRDEYTAGHQQRVKQLACAIAREMHLPIGRIEIIRVAGLLHDFGKMFVPIDILIKPGKLNDLEFSLVRSHPQSGYYVLKTIEFPWPIADIILQHHERMDGSGYPSHLHGEEIAAETRILAVADVVEAMSSHRSYRPALGLDAALMEINKNKSTLYDPKVAEACLDTFLDRGFKWENV